MTNASIREATMQPPITGKIMRRRWTWLGHVLRMDVNAFPRRVLHFTPPGGSRSRGRPPFNIRSAYENDIRLMGLSWTEITRLAADRTRWRQLVEARCPG